MFENSKLFRRSARPTGLDNVSVQEIRDEFHACVHAVPARAQVVDHSCVDIEPHVAGALEDGRRLSTVMLRLVKWDRPAGWKVLIGLPILERETRRAITASWAAEAAHFGGLWLHPSGKIINPLLSKSWRTTWRSRKNLSLRALR